MAACLLDACVLTLRDQNLSLQKEMEEEIVKHVPIIVSISMDAMDKYKKSNDFLAVVTILDKLLKNKLLIKEIEQLIHTSARVMDKYNIYRKDLIGCFLSKCDKEGLRAVQHILGIWEGISKYLGLFEASLQKYGKFLNEIAKETKKELSKAKKRGYSSRR